MLIICLGSIYIFYYLSWQCRAASECSINCTAVGDFWWRTVLVQVSVPQHVVPKMTFFSLKGQYLVERQPCVSIQILTRIFSVHVVNNIDLTINTRLIVTARGFRSMHSFHLLISVLT
jgi:hypothetical protein